MIRRMFYKASLVLTLLTAHSQAQDSLNVSRIGEIASLYALGVAVSGSYAYVSAYSTGLHVVNISNPASPVEVGHYDTPGYALGVAVSGSYAYVADFDAGLRVVNVSNPASPVEVGYYNTPGAAKGVAIAGNYAYVADYGDGLRVVNVTSPDNPVEVGYCDTPGMANGVAVAGNYAYVADDYAGLRVVNVSNPASPMVVGFYDTPESAYAVAIAGNYVYVADYTAGLRVVNVNNPVNPVEVGYYNTPGYAMGVAVAGNYVYVADCDAGLRVVNVSNQAAPQEVGYYNTPWYAYGVAVFGSYTYVADEYDFGIYQFTPPGYYLSINTYPINPPIVIPFNGGIFYYNAIVQNLGTSTQTFQGWNKVRDAANLYTQVFGPVTRTLPGGANPSHILIQRIAGSIPSGTLFFISYIGTYPNTIVDSSFFTIMKLAVEDDGPWISESNCTGDLLTDFADVSSAKIFNSAFIIHNCVPNPFNPTTVLSFELRVSSIVSLKVYDTTGRLVATLVDGWREAGDQLLTFDGSNLASGVYIYRLSVGDEIASGKMVLLK